MPDPFDHLIPDAQRFLTELSANNARDWFLAHKARYESELKRPAELLLEQISPTLTKLSGGAIRPKLFRPQRDVRFSKDKTPYKTRLYVMWTLADAAAPVSWFFGTGPGFARLGAGLMGFDAPALTNWRAAVDGPLGDAISGHVAELEKQGFHMGETDLKRVPPPYPADHRHGDLLRRKSFGIWRDLPPGTTGLTKLLQQDFTRLWPLVDDLQTALS